MSSKCQAPIHTKLTNSSCFHTPINHLQKFQQILKEKCNLNEQEVPQIFMKRDDLNELLLTGNKIRKLEFILADAKQNGYSTVITCGGVQSNHARATAVAAVQMGLKCILVLRTPDGKPPSEIDGNLFISLMVGAQVEYITPDDYRQRRNSIMKDIAIKLENEKGEKVYVIPEGGSSALGLWGYIQMMKELKDQTVTFSHIFCAVGSGGTIGGLLVGKWNYDRKEEIVGIPVCDDAAYFREKIGALVTEFEQKFQCKVEIGNYELLDGYVGSGYSIPYPAQIEWMKTLATTEGILLDPTYSGKAFYGMIDQIQKKKFTSNDKILFIHTGGIFGIFPQKQKFC